MGVGMGRSVVWVVAMGIGVAVVFVVSGVEVEACGVCGVFVVLL